jgi:hypothetical protein
MTLWRLYAYETLLERLTQDFQEMASERSQFIQEKNAVRDSSPLERIAARFSDGL